MDRRRVTYQFDVDTDTIDDINAALRTTNKSINFLLHPPISAQSTPNKKPPCLPTQHTPTPQPLSQFDHTAPIQINAESVLSMTTPTNTGRLARLKESRKTLQIQQQQQPHLDLNKINNEPLFNINLSPINQMTVSLTTEPININHHYPHPICSPCGVDINSNTDHCVASSQFHSPVFPLSVIPAHNSNFLSQPQHSPLFLRNPREIPSQRHVEDSMFLLPQHIDPAQAFHTTSSFEMPQHPEQFLPNPNNISSEYFLIADNYREDTPISNNKNALSQSNDNTSQQFSQMSSPPQVPLKLEMEESLQHLTQSEPFNSLLDFAQSPSDELNIDQSILILQDHALAILPKSSASSRCTSHARVGFEPAVEPPHTLEKSISQLQPLEFATSSLSMPSKTIFDGIHPLETDIHVVLNQCVRILNDSPISTMSKEHVDASVLQEPEPKPNTPPLHHSHSQHNEALIIPLTSHEPTIPTPISPSNLSEHFQCQILEEQLLVPFTFTDQPSNTHISPQNDGKISSNTLIVVQAKNISLQPETPEATPSNSQTNCSDELAPEQSHNGSISLEIPQMNISVSYDPRQPKHISNGGFYETELYCNYEFISSKVTQQSQLIENIIDDPTNIDVLSHDEADDNHYIVTVIPQLLHKEPVCPEMSLSSDNEVISVKSRNAEDPTSAIDHNIEDNENAAQNQQQNHHYVNHKHIHKDIGVSAQLADHSNLLDNPTSISQINPTNVSYYAQMIPIIQAEDSLRQPVIHETRVSIHDLAFDNDSIAIEYPPTQTETVLNDDPFSEVDENAHPQHISIIEQIICTNLQSYHHEDSFSYENPVDCNCDSVPQTVNQNVTLVPMCLDDVEIFLTVDRSPPEHPPSIIESQHIKIFETIANQDIIVDQAGRLESIPTVIDEPVKLENKTVKDDVAGPFYLIEPLVEAGTTPKLNLIKSITTNGNRIFDQNVENLKPPTVIPNDVTEISVDIEPAPIDGTVIDNDLTPTSTDIVPSPSIELESTPVKDENYRPLFPQDDATAHHITHAIQLQPIQVDERTTQFDVRLSCPTKTDSIEIIASVQSHLDPLKIASHTPNEPIDNESTKLTGEFLRVECVLEFEPAPLEIDILTTTTTECVQPNFAQENNFTQDSVPHTAISLVNSQSDDVSIPNSATESPATIHTDETEPISVDVLSSNFEEVPTESSLCRYSGVGESELIRMRPDYFNVNNFDITQNIALSPPSIKSQTPQNDILEPLPANIDEPIELQDEVLTSGPDNRNVSLDVTPSDAEIDCVPSISDIVESQPSSDSTFDQKVIEAHLFVTSVNPPINISEVVEVEVVEVGATREIDADQPIEIDLLKEPNEFEVVEPKRNVICDIYAPTIKCTEIDDVTCDNFSMVQSTLPYINSYCENTPNIPATPQNEPLIESQIEKHSHMHTLADNQPVINEPYPHNGERLADNRKVVEPFISDDGTFRDNQFVADEPTREFNVDTQVSDEISINNAKQAFAPYILNIPELDNREQFGHNSAPVSIEYHSNFKMDFTPNLLKSDHTFFKNASHGDVRQEIGLQCPISELRSESQHFHVENLSISNNDIIVTADDQYIQDISLGYTILDQQQQQEEPRIVFLSTEHHQTQQNKRNTPVKTNNINVFEPSYAEEPESCIQLGRIDQTKLSLQEVDMIVEYPQDSDTEEQNECSASPDIAEAVSVASDHFPPQNDPNVNISHMHQFEVIAAKKDTQLDVAILEPSVVPQTTNIPEKIVQAQVALTDTIKIIGPNNPETNTLNGDEPNIFSAQPIPQDEWPLELDSASNQQFISSNELIDAVNGDIVIFEAFEPMKDICAVEQGDTDRSIKIEVQATLVSYPQVLQIPDSHQDIVLDNEQNDALTVVDINGLVNDVDLHFKEKNFVNNFLHESIYPETRQSQTNDSNGPFYKPELPQNMTKIANLAAESQDNEIIEQYQQKIQSQTNHLHVEVHEFPIILVTIEPDSYNDSPGQSIYTPTKIKNSEIVIDDHNEEVSPDFNDVAMCFKSDTSFFDIIPPSVHIQVPSINEVDENRPLDALQQLVKTHVSYPLRLEDQFQPNDEDSTHNTCISPCDNNNPQSSHSLPSSLFPQIQDQNHFAPTSVEHLHRPVLSVASSEASIFDILKKPTPKQCQLFDLSPLTPLKHITEQHISTLPSTSNMSDNSPNDQHFLHDLIPQSQSVSVIKPFEQHLNNIALPCPSLNLSSLPSVSLTAQSNTSVALNTGDNHISNIPLNFKRINSSSSLSDLMEPFNHFQPQFDEFSRRMNLSPYHANTVEPIRRKPNHHLPQTPSMTICLPITIASIHDDDDLYENADNILNLEHPHVFAPPDSAKNSKKNISQGEILKKLAVELSPLSKKPDGGNEKENEGKNNETVTSNTIVQDEKKKNVPPSHLYPDNNTDRVEGSYNSLPFQPEPQAQDDTQRYKPAEDECILDNNDQISIQAGELATTEVLIHEKDIVQTSRQNHPLATQSLPIFANNELLPASSQPSPQKQPKQFKKTQTHIDIQIQTDDISFIEVNHPSFYVRNPPVPYPFASTSASYSVSRSHVSITDFAAKLHLDPASLKQNLNLQRYSDMTSNNQQPDDEIALTAEIDHDVDELVAIELAESHLFFNNIITNNSYTELPHHIPQLPADDYVDVDVSTLQHLPRHYARETPQSTVRDDLSATGHLFSTQNPLNRHRTTEDVLYENFPIFRQENDPFSSPQANHAYPETNSEFDPNIPVSPSRELVKKRPALASPIILRKSDKDQHTLNIICGASFENEVMRYLFCGPQANRSILAETDEKLHLIYNEEEFVQMEKDIQQLAPPTFDPSKRIATYTPLPPRSLVKDQTEIQRLQHSFHNFKIKQQQQRNDRFVGEIIDASDVISDTISVHSNYVHNNHNNTIKPTIHSSPQVSYTSSTRARSSSQSFFPAQLLSPLASAQLQLPSAQPPSNNGPRPDNMVHPITTIVNNTPSASGFQFPIKLHPVHEGHLSSSTTYITPYNSRDHDSNTNNNIIPTSNRQRTMSFTPNTQPPRNFTDSSILSTTSNHDYFPSPSVKFQTRPMSSSFNPYSSPQTQHKPQSQPIHFNYYVPTHSQQLLPQSPFSPRSSMIKNPMKDPQLCTIKEPQKHNNSLQPPDQDLTTNTVTPPTNFKTNPIKPKQLVLQTDNRIKSLAYLGFVNTTNIHTQQMNGFMMNNTSNSILEQQTSSLQFSYNPFDDDNRHD